MKTSVIAVVYLSALAANVAGQSIGSQIITTIAGSGLRGDGGPATAVQLLSPTGVAVDAAGNLYIADTAIIRKVTPDGIISTIAGNGIAGFAGDRSPASLATRLGSFLTLFIDSRGNLYIADANNHRIRRITPDGMIDTVAGSGTSGNQGDGGQAAAARLNRPNAVVADASGNLYIADTSNHTIRQVKAGIISTIAGTGESGYNGDGPSASTRQLYNPSGLSLDPAGNLYIADAWNHRIRKLTPAGVISTVAGNGTQGSGQTGVALASQLQYPMGVLLSPTGDFYIADSTNNLIEAATPAGALRTVAGTNSGQGYGGDGKPAVSAQLNFPRDMALDAAGNLYVADQYNRRVRKVTPEGVITTVAGNANGSGETADTAQLAFPHGLAVSGGGLYIADTSNNIVRKLSVDGTLTTVAGLGGSKLSGDTGPAALAELSAPGAIAIDGGGAMYIADSGNHRIRQVTPGGLITTIAGTGASAPFVSNPSFNGDGQPLLARFNSPQGIALDAGGNLYVSDTSNHRVRKITKSGQLTTIAGTGEAGFSGDNGPAVKAQLNYPSGITVDGAGNIYVADWINNRIRKIAPDGTISTVAGAGTYNYSGDGGPAVAATLRRPRGVALDSSGNLYIADTDNNRIRMVNPAGVINTIAGNGAATFLGDGGPPLRSQFNPLDVTVDVDGSIYISDGNGQRIRKIETVRIAAASVLNGASLLAGAIAPGELLTINGLAIGPSDAMSAQASDSGLIGTALGETRVFFDGVPAAIRSTQASQVQVTAPYALAGQTTTRLVVEYKGKRTNAVTLQVASSAPGILTRDSSGKGQGAINNADGSGNTPGNAASVGSTVTIFATGEGQTDPPGVDGKIAADVLAKPLLPVSVKIGGIDAPVVDYGSVPNAVAGSFQVSVTIPDGVTVGAAVPVVLTVGLAQSQPGVTMAIQ
jgi:uncharacterized protein (TIGR03437 family)